MAAKTRMLVPYAHVADVERSIGFYAGLGFKVKNTVVPDGQAAPVWAWLDSEKANLMVGLASGPIDSAQQAVLFYLYYDDIKQAHAALAALVTRRAGSSTRSTCRASSGLKIRMVMC
ncbi:MAG TPA: VOC family protein [Rhodanobacteraceae bacterium]|nr:VOC family protein [Rhodanobacteraceae bacterium]